MVSEELQDELGAIDAIYPDSLKELGGPNIYHLTIPQHEEVTITLSFPEDYPHQIFHILEISSKNKDLDVEFLEILFKEVLESLFHPGEVCIFDFLTELDSILYVEPDSIGDNANTYEPAEEYSYQEISHDRVIDPSRYSKKKDSSKLSSQNHDASNETNKASDPIQSWIASDPVVDRGSTFVAFAREVHSLDEAHALLEHLLTDRRVMRSAHNMTCWRIKLGNGTQIQDCDDDGEKAAGSRILHLMTMMDVWNVMVVVCRWFGGTHLGPDRFKHINSSCRDAIIKGGFLPQGAKGNKAVRKKK